MHFIIFHNSVINIGTLWFLWCPRKHNEGIKRATTTFSQHSHNNMKLQQLTSPGVKYHTAEHDFALGIFTHLLCRNKEKKNQNNSQPLVFCLQRINYGTNLNELKSPLWQWLSNLGGAALAAVPETSLCASALLHCDNLPFGLSNVMWVDSGAL